MLLLLGHQKGAPLALVEVQQLLLLGRLLLLLGTCLLAAQRQRTTLARARTVGACIMIICIITISICAQSCAGIGAGDGARVGEVVLEEQWVLLLEHHLVLLAGRLRQGVDLVLLVEKLDLLDLLRVARRHCHCRPRAILAFLLDFSSISTQFLLNFRSILS